MYYVELQKRPFIQTNKRTQYSDGRKKYIYTLQKKCVLLSILIYKLQNKEDSNNDYIFLHVDTFVLHNMVRGKKKWVY